MLKLMATVAREKRWIYNMVEGGVMHRRAPNGGGKGG